ncbi:MAG: hypothetical protein CMJ23_08990 [Phycisphaerae bacterium]|nr:hypothetical protein [Phycisphaerae bacterium]
MVPGFKKASSSRQTDREDDTRCLIDLIERRIRSGRKGTDFTGHERTWGTESTDPPRKRSLRILRRVA